MRPPCPYYTTTFPFLHTPHDSISTIASISSHSTNATNASTFHHYHSHDTRSSASVVRNITIPSTFSLLCLLPFRIPNFGAHRSPGT